jgi:uncharacterized protein YcbK (DUF882 family)
MSDRLKSSKEIAMEKLDRMVGEETRTLTDHQKQRIAEIKRDYEAKVAEKKIMLAGCKELVDELQKLHQERERKIEAVYREAQGNT